MSERIRFEVNRVLVEHRGKQLTARNLAVIESELVVAMEKLRKKKKKKKVTEKVPAKKKKKGRSCVVAVPNVDGSVTAQQTKGQAYGIHPYDKNSVVAHPDAEE